MGGCASFSKRTGTTPLPRNLTFATPEEIIQLADRGGALKNLAARQAIQHGIEIGRGGVDLMLTHEQYAKLKRG